MTRTNSLSRAKAVALAFAALVLGVLAAVWQDLPQWRVGGSRSTPASSVAFLPHQLGCPADGARIAIIGDSHVAGSRLDAGSASFGAVLEQSLGRGVKITRYGVGGETAAGGEKRWQARKLAKADLVILAYGTNDAAPRGWLRDKMPVPIEAYKSSLARQIAGWRRRGHEVALLAPSPGGSAAITARIAPYREAARDVGRTHAVAVLDPADAFASCPAAQPVLLAEALHMNANGHQCLGEWLAQQLCPSTPSPP